MMIKAVSAEENRNLILQSLSERGILYDLTEGEFSYTGPEGILSDLEKEAIDACRESLSIHLRRQRGLCIACGLLKARRPSYVGYKDREDSKNGHIRQDAPQWYRERYPQSWCNHCWERRAWKP